MASANLTWTAPSPLTNVSSVTVKYRTYGSGTWLTAAAGLPGSTNSYTVTGLQDNRVYEFQVTTICSSGGPTDSGIDEDVVFVCLPLTVTGTTSSTVSFTVDTTNANGLDQITVRLYQNDGVTQVSSKVYTAPFANPITDSFTGLAGSTTYKLRVDNRASGASVYNYTTCSQTSATTPAAVCPAPTGLTATMVAS